MNKLTKFRVCASRTRKALTILTVSLFASEGVLADEVIRSVSHGTFELPLLLVTPAGERQIGELVTCEPPTPLLLRFSTTFDRYERVCDDLGSTPCDGRLVGTTEFCVGTADESQSGLIRGAYGNSSRTRICWDPSATGQCSVEYEVATGEAVGSQIQELVDAPSARSIGVARVVSSKPFRVDGRTVKISQATSKFDNLFETEHADPAPFPCFFPEPLRTRPDGCGIVSINTGSAGDD